MAAASNNGAARRPQPSRHQILALAAALTATVLTMGLAVAGLTRQATPAPSPPQTVSQVIGQQPTTPARVEPGD